jgi:tetratricopeptide (TPR) repeat protein
VAWYLGFAERHGGGAEGRGRSAGPSEFTGVIDDLRQALNWARDEGPPGTAARLAIALAAYWSGRGLLREGAAALEAALDDAVDDQQRARVHYWLAVIRGLGLGDYEPAARAATASLELSRATDDLLGAAHASLILAPFTFILHGREAAIPLVEEGLALYRLHGDDGLVGFATDYLGFMHEVGGDHGTARRLFHEALERQRVHGDDAEVAWELGRLASLDLDAGMLDDAARRLADAEAALRRCGGKRALGVVLGLVSALALRRGDHDTALAVARETLAAGREAGSVTVIVTGLRNLAFAAQGAGRLDDARRWLSEYARIASRLRYREGMANAIEELASIDAAEGDPARAATLYAVATRMRHELSISIPDRHRALVDELRATLGDEFSACWARGDSLDSTDAIALAGVVL